MPRYTPEVTNSRRATLIVARSEDHAPGVNERLFTALLDHQNIKYGIKYDIFHVMRTTKGSQSPANGALVEYRGTFFTDFFAFVDYLKTNGLILC